MKTRSFLDSLGFVVATLALLSPVVARAALQHTGSSEVAFDATGSMGMRIHGSTHDLQFREDGENFVVKVPLARLGTGISLRDEHMRNYLDVAHHPDAILTVPRSGVTMPTTGAASGDARGTMELHGRTHPITFHYRAEPHDGKIKVSGTARLDIGDYGIEVPSYLGVTVNRQVNVSANFHVHDR